MKRTVAGRPKLEHLGFDRYGSLIRSAVPVDNQPTNFLSWLAREARAKLLSPALAVEEIARADERLRSVFAPDTMGAWHFLERFWMWPLARCSRPAEEFVRLMGEPRHVWIADPHRWEKLCEDAERLHRTECRYTHVRPEVLAGQRLAIPDGLVFECSVHGQVRP